MTGSHFLGKLRRDLQAGVSATSPNLARHLLDALYFADDAESFGVDEAIDQLATFHRSIFVQDDHRHMFHVRIEGVSEGDHLHERREEHEEQSHGIAPDDDEFLEENGTESAKWSTFHGAQKGALTPLSSPPRISH